MINILYYLGTWYEVYKFKANFENNQKCIQANYQLKPDGHIRVNNTGVSLRFVTILGVLTLNCEQLR